MAAASLTLALIHLFVWIQQRRQREHLLFFFLAISAAVFGAFELAMMHAETPLRMRCCLRWAHVPLCAFVLSIVGFVHFYLDAGRMWLAYTVCGVRLLALFLNFSIGPNVNFREITAIDPVTLWGGAVISAPVGIASPWSVVPQIGNLLLLAFILDASISLWRRGDTAQRRRALLVGGSLAVLRGDGRLLRRPRRIGARAYLDHRHARSLCDCRGHGLRARVGSHHRRKAGEAAAGE